MVTILLVLPCVLVSLGIGGGLYLFWTLKHDLRNLSLSLTRAARKQQVASEARCDALDERLRAAEDRSGVLVAPPAPRSGLNLTRRTQVIRMAKGGENAEAIASTLQLPRNEVKLLLKMQPLHPDQPGDLKA